MDHHEEHGVNHVHTHHHEAPQQISKRDELMALMHYMVGHNASHMRELSSLAAQLADAGEHTAYEAVLSAVADFENGNAKLAALLDTMKYREG